MEEVTGLTTKCPACNLGANEGNIVLSLFCQNKGCPMRAYDRGEKSQIVPLKNCPFCGGKHMNIMVDFQTSQQGMFDVTCQKCSVTTSRYDCREDAIDAWNTRISSDDT